MEEEEEETCPLCMEPMDVTDQSASLCDCGYSMCLWCWHQIMENAAKDSLPARCPNCRSEYDKERITNATVDPEKVAQAMQKKREEKKKNKVVTDRKALANVRVIQRNLVYVVGLSMHICREEALRKNDYFGQFGRIVKISVNRAGPYSAATGKSSPTGSAYVTFVRNSDALRCIEAIDGCVWDGNSVRACFGTTKYCNSFLKGIMCTNPDCLYLHEIAPEDNESFTKEQMLARYGNQKSSNFFELTHPLASQQQQQENDSMAEMREMEMQESDNMRSQPQSIPQGASSSMQGQFGSRNDSWSGQGGAWGSPPPPPPPRGMGPPPGMQSGMGIPPGMQAGMNIPGGLGHRRQSSGGGGMATANSGSFDGPSWGQVAAAGNRAVPPPPPPNQPPAQEEWPELGAGPKVGDTGMIKSSSGSGKIPMYRGLSSSSLPPGPKVKGELSNMLNGRSESMETLGGVMVAKPPAGRSKAPGPPGASAQGIGGLSSPFLTAAGPQSAPMPKQNSGMLTMTLPSSRTESAGVAAGRSGSGKVVKGPPPGFAPPLTSSALSSGTASMGVRGPPPGFAGPTSSAAAAAPQRSGSNDNDVLNSLVASLKGELVAPSKNDPPAPPASTPAPSSASAPSLAPASEEPLAQALQGLELLGAAANGSQQGGRQGGVPSLPPGFDVWSADVPPAFAGLATASYNPMGLASQGDPSARYLLRNPPAQIPVASGTAAVSSGGARSAGGGNGITAGENSESLASTGQSRSRSRFQFAQEDSKEGVSDPLWQGASGDGIPAAVDIFKMLRQGNASGTAAMKAPPGFGGAEGTGSGVPPGMALLQQLQLGRGGQAGPAAPPGFLDPAIVTSRAGMVGGAPAQGLRPSGGSGVVRPPPGFGGSQQQQPPIFSGRAIDTVAADSSTQRWDSR